METDASPASRTHGRTDSVSGHVTDEDDDDVLDPRVQRELDQLNVASADINQLENELDEARTKYRSIVSEMSNRMEAIGQDQKRCIRKSREYYKLINEAKMAQNEALKAARQFQTATGVYSAAKETVALAERSLREEMDTASAAQLTSAWQEMLSNAVTKLTEAEREKTRCEKEHKRRAAKFAEIETRKQMLEKKQSRSIKKARPYFELKMQLDIRLMQQKQNVTDLQAAIKGNKIKYKAALRRLEKISEEIHQSRSEKLWSQIPRMPGVGADTESISSGLSELALDSFDIKDDTDSTSVDGESMKDFCDGIDLVIGADNDPHNDLSESVELVTENTVMPDGYSDNVDLGTNNMIKPSGHLESEELVEGNMGTCNTEPEVGADTNFDSEEEVFEDAQTGADDVDETDNDEVKDTTEITEHDKTVGCDENASQENSTEINKDVDGYNKGNSDPEKTETDHSELNEVNESTKVNTLNKVSGADSHRTNLGDMSYDAEEGSTMKEVSEKEPTEDIGYAEMNMRDIERPSLSGEEE